MKKFLASASVAFLALTGVAFVGTSAANATTEVCVPSEAWTETVIVTPEVPAVPEILEVSHTVEHPAEYVHHEAVTHTEYHFAKFTRERTKEWSWGGSDWGPWGSWSKYSPETHTSWELGNSPIGSPQFHSSGTRYGGTVQWERQWQAQWDGQTRVIEDKAAWDEKVKDAWTEKVIDQAYVPGTPAIPAVTKTVEHPAVECPPVKEYPPVIVPVQLGVVTAPDCDTDGSYSVEGLTPAENANGWEGDGYHFYVKNTTGDFGGPGLYTWEAYGIGANGNEDYPLGTSVGGKVDKDGNPKAGGKVTGSFEVLPATGDCPVVTTPANPQASFEAICGSADLTLTNPGETNLTASFVVNVDGEFYGAYSVPANESQRVSFSFSEDSGTHNIQVFQAGTSEWKEIANADVPSDCELPPVVEPPVVKPPVVNPPVVNPPAPAAAVVPMGGDEPLAETGLGAWIWGVLAAGLALLGGGAYFRFRPQHN